MFLRVNCYYERHLFGFGDKLVCGVHSQCMYGKQVKVCQRMYANFGQVQSQTQGHTRRACTSEADATLCKIRNRKRTGKQNQHRQ